jgi:hypothetical protein
MGNSLLPPTPDSENHGIWISRTPGSPPSDFVLNYPSCHICHPATELCAHKHGMQRGIGVATIVTTVLVGFRGALRHVNLGRARGEIGPSLLHVNLSDSVSVTKQPNA